MRRLALAAIPICLALGLGWFLMLKDENTDSQKTEKPRAGTTTTTQTSSAQTKTPETILAEGNKPSQAQTTETLAPQTLTGQTTSVSQTSTSSGKLVTRPAAWASGAVDQATATRMHTPGEGLPAATQETIRGLVSEATALEDKGDLPGAIDTNKKILKLDRKAAITMNVIAGLYGKLGDYRREADWARNAIAVNPKFTEAYINLGNAMGAAGRPAEARKAFNKTIELDPKSPLGVYSLGVVAENQYKFRKALKYYEQSAKIDPKFENGYYNAAAMYANLKEYDAAMDTLDKLRQINPNDEDAKLLDASISNKKAMAMVNAKAKAAADSKPKLARIAHKHRGTHRLTAKRLRVSAKIKHKKHHHRTRA